METGRTRPSSPFGLTYAIVSSIARREAEMVFAIWNLSCGAGFRIRLPSTALELWEAGVVQQFRRWVPRRAGDNEAFTISAPSSSVSWPAALPAEPDGLT
jgi:hypothetical protein